MKIKRQRAAGLRAAGFALFLVGVLMLVPLAAFASGQRVRNTSLTTAERPEDAGLSSERLARIDSIMKGYVDSESIAGAVVMIGRRGKIAYLESFGMADIEGNRPMRTDSMFRLASMSKAIVSLAVMMLYEEGHFLLNDPVSKYIPEFAEMQVIVPEGDGYTLVPAEKPITIRHLVTHTSGIVYSFFGHPHITEIYLQAGINDGLDQSDGTIGEMVKRLAGLPLLFQPGEAFGYGLNVDVLGYFVEVISGQALDRLLEERIFVPLEMQDIHFYVPQEKVSRMAAVYGPNPEGGLARWGDEAVTLGPLVFRASLPYSSGSRSYFSGGGGLTSTAGDYGRFLQMMLNGGELEGVRLIGRKTVELMTSNHIEGLYADFARYWDGDKFGLGFAIRTERGVFDELESLGSYGWGGFYDTHFWIDPSEDMFGILMLQLFPANHLTIRRKFRIAVNQAIID